MPFSAQVWVQKLSEERMNYLFNQMQKNWCGSRLLQMMLDDWEPKKAATLMTVRDMDRDLGDILDMWGYIGGAKAMGDKDAAAKDAAAQGGGCTG